MAINRFVRQGEFVFGQDVFNDEIPVEVKEIFFVFGHGVRLLVLGFNLHFIRVNTKLMPELNCICVRGIVR